MQLTCDTEITARGIEVTHKVLGKIATIERRDTGWFVFPYVFPPAERGATFKSLEAAEYYALALAHEMHALGLPKVKETPQGDVVRTYERDGASTGHGC